MFTFDSERSPILDSKKLQSYFEECLAKCKNEIIVCSAFIKLSGIEWFSNNIKNKEIKCRVISRWDKEDLIKRVSDIEVYEFCKNKGWDQAFFTGKGLSSPARHSRLMVLKARFALALILR